MGEQGTTQDSESDQTKGRVSRRQFLKFSAGAAAVAAGAVAIMDKIPVSYGQPEKVSASTGQGEPMVVAVRGDELTLISGYRSVKVKDSVLAAILAGKSKEA